MKTLPLQKKPYLGFGLGLRADHYQTILSQKPKIDWFEVITENYLVSGGKPLYYLEKIRDLYPMAMHGVSLSIGSTDPLDFNYLKEVKTLANRIEPAWISDHLCWTGVQGINTHDLLPLPYSYQVIDHIVERIQKVQDYLGRRILIENVSSYLTFKQSEIYEWEFLAEIVERADCYILLDVNNVYVSAINHHFDPRSYLNHLPGNRIYQIHLAGHTNHGNYIVDTHDAPIVQAVWELYREAIRYFGPVSTIIERDDNIPALEELLTELNFAKKICKKILRKQEVA